MSAGLRRVIAALFGVAVVGGAIVWLSGGFGARVAPGVVASAARVAPKDAPRARVERRIEDAVEWTSGALASKRRTAVSAQILGRIEQVDVRAGDRVAEGDVVVRLDAQEASARAAEARQALASAKARRDLARTEMTRVGKLFERGVVTRQRLDQATADLREAEAEVERLSRALEAAETALSYTVIHAPVGGLVIDRLAEPGEIASPGRPLLRIYDPAALRVEAAVRESLAVKLALGQVLRVRVPALGKSFEGKIEEIVPFAEPGARTLLIKVGLPRDKRLYAGLFARVAIPAGQRARLTVPEAAVSRIGQLAFVTVIGEGERLARRMVTLGRRDAEGRLDVLSGLAEGETVLLSRGPAQP